MMRWFYKLPLRFRSLFRKSHVERELSNELRFHLEKLIDECVAKGMTRDEARYEALRELGGLDQIKEESRDMRRVKYIEDLVKDVHYGMRQLRRNPSFTIVAVLALALGIGGTTAVFSTVYAVLIAPEPYPQADQLVMVWSKVGNYNKGYVSPADFLDWKRENHVFQSMVAWIAPRLTLTVNNTPINIPAWSTTPGAYSQYGDRFLYGHDFTPNDGQPGQDHEIILTHKLWQAQFHSDPHIIGKQVQVNGESYTVTGVLPAGINDHNPWVEADVPLAFQPSQINHRARYLFVMARLKPGVTIGQAQAEMDIIAQEIAHQNPMTNKNVCVSVQPFHNDFLPENTPTELLILLAAVGADLLIACADVANLLLARGMVRRKEVALRAAIGASRGNILRLFLTESLMLSLAGGATGVFLAWGFLHSFLSIIPAGDLPMELQIGMSWPVLMFTLSISILTGVLAGIMPAWRASRVDLNEDLKEGGRAGMGGERHRLQSALVVAESGLAVMLLALAGMTVHSFANLNRVHLGFQPNHVLTGNLPVLEKSFTQESQIAPFFQEILDRVKAIPGVRDAAVSTAMPLNGPGFGMDFWFAGQPRPPSSEMKFVGVGSVTPEYFHTFGIRVLRGREFIDADGPESQPVAMVNEEFVKTYLYGRDALEQQLMTPKIEPLSEKIGEPVAWQVVGVYANVRNGKVESEVRPEMLVPFAQMPWSAPNLVVRTQSEAMLLAHDVAQAVQSVDGNLAFAQATSMKQIISESMATERSLAAIFSAFAILALLLAAAGVYGVMSFATTQRTHEIGVRMALGADPARVMRATLREGVVLALEGAVFGLTAAVLTGKLIEKLFYFYKVGKFDWPSLLATLAILIVVALAGCWIPARRATKVDPMVALRYE